MHKLTNMEAQRVIAVLEDCVERLSLVSLVPTAALEPETVEREFGDDLKSALRQQWQVEEGHGVLSSTSQLAEGAARADLDEVRRQLGKSTRNLARTLRKHEQAVAFFKRRPTKSRSNEFVSCQQFLSDLTAVMFRKLSTTVEEETTNNSTLHDLTERERFAAEEATALQKTLEAQRAERDREVSQQEATLTKLRAELQDITQTNQAKMDEVRSKMDAEIARTEDEHKQRMKELLDSINALESGTDRDATQNREVEAALRKKKERVEAELTTQIQNYDNIMFEMQRKTEDLKVKMTDESEQLRLLEEYFTKIDANEGRRVNELKLLSAFKDKVAKAEKVLDDAATHVQRIARGRQIRASIRQLMSKKGGKKGGAKAKKGGKKAKK